MKTTVTTLERGNRIAETMDLKTISTNVRSKITDRICITVASASVVAFIFSLMVVNMPAILVSGLTALGAVAAAPMNCD